MNVPLNSLVNCPEINTGIESSKQFIDDLAKDIKISGIKKPLIVRPVGDKFEVICGFKRWKAAAIAGLNVIPVEKRDLTNAEAAYLSMTE